MSKKRKARKPIPLRLHYEMMAAQARLADAHHWLNVTTVAHDTAVRQVQAMKRLIDDIQARAKP